MDQPAAFDPADRAGFRQWTEERVRFADLDPLGHVNNNAIGIYFETGRLGFFREADLHGAAAGQATVVARISIDFRVELTFPNDVVIGTRPVRIGTSSFTYRQGLFAGEVCIATAETVSVLFDLRTRRPAALTGAQKARLAAWL